MLTSEKARIAYLLVVSVFVIIALPQCGSRKHKGKHTPVRKHENKKPVAESNKKQEVKKVELSDAQKVERVVEKAKTFIGTPYKFGGTSRAGLDCSGLVVLAFEAADMQMPRVSVQQSEVGHEVKVKDVKAGDLLFFSTSSKHRSGINHVGIVVENKGNGDVRFIHASTKLGVVIGNLNQKYYTDSFVMATRPY